MFGVAIVSGTSGRTAGGSSPRISVAGITEEEAGDGS